MRTTHKWQNIYRTISLAIGVLISLFGIVSLIVWHLGKSSLLIIPPSRLPISYMACLAFLTSGIALILLFLQRRIVTVNIIGFGIFIISILKISEILFHVNTGLKNLFFEWFWYDSHEFNFTALLASASFSLIGMVFLLWKRRPRSIFLSNITTLIAIIVFFIGLVESFSYVLPINYSFYFHKLIPMNFYTALGFSLLSIGILITNRYFDNQENLQVNNWLPFYVGFSFFCFSIFVILGVYSQKRKIIHEMMVNQAYFFETEIKDDLRENALFLKKMAQTVKILKNQPSQLWEEELRFYITDLPEIHAIFWLDKDFNIKSEYQVEDKKRDLDLPETLLKLKSHLSFLLEKKAYFFVDTKDKYFFLINPIFENDQYVGSVMEVVVIERFFKKILDKIKNDYIFSVYAHDVLIFGKENRKNSTYKKWGESKTIQIENEKLTIDFFPTREMIQRWFNDIIIPIMFLASGLLSSFAAFLVYFLQIANKRLILVEDARQKMRMASEERDSALQAAQVGLISYDIKHEMVNFDPRSAHLFGYESHVSRIEFKEFLSNFPSEYRNKLINDIQDMQNKEDVFDYEFHVQWPDRSNHDVRTRGKVFQDENRHPMMISGVAWDVSAIKKTQMLLQLSESIAKLLSESMPLNQTASHMLNLFHEFLEWEVMVIWRINKTSDVLECLEVVNIPELHIPMFIDASKHLVFTTGEMFPGYVWATFRPVWFKNINEEQKFSRGKKSDVVFQGALAFPFFEEGDFAGVIELFKRMPLIEDIDQAKLNMLSTVGLTFGHFLQREESESMIQQLASIVTYSTEGIYSVDVNGIIKTWNVGMARMFGWKASEIIGQHVTILYPEDKYQEFEKLHQLILNGKSIEHYQTQRLHKDKNLMWVEITVAPIFDTNKNIVGGSIIVQDISQEHEMISTIKRSEGKFRAFIETTEEWIWEMDKDAVFTYSNPSVKKILGIDPEEVIGKQLYYFISNKEYDKVKGDIESCKQHKTGWSKRILTFVHRNGSECTLEGNAQPIFDDDEQLIGYRGADRDITAQKNVERLKNEFISIVSHELRTPLTSIHGALGLLINDSDLPPKPKNLLEIAYRNSIRLTRIIDDILSVEKLELGLLEMAMGPVFIVDVIEEAIASSKMAADKVQVVLKKIISDKSLIAIGNYERLMQVLLNLISNAMKFSKPHDQVTISVESLDHIVRISVQDQGPGIPEEFQKKIFGKFAQADSSAARSKGGAGLGLNICKSIIEKMGGRMDFVTKKNEGTKFYFDLPRGQ